ncbi:hypothetical protein NPIL_495741, partial [Nephila pilipes]
MFDWSLEEGPKLWLRMGRSRDCGTSPTRSADPLACCTLQ